MPPAQTAPALAEAADAGLVFDADFLARLERLELLARKLFRGQLRGERTTPRRGRGLEFSDFRRYQPGDDLRYIDWNIYSRLDRLFLKLYASEEDLSLHLLLDASASMGFGTPSKFDHARRLAAALAYIGLANLDRVEVVAFADGLGAPVGPLKSRRAMPQVLAHLAERTAAGPTAVEAALRGFSARARAPGLVVMVSDLASGGSWTEGIDLLRRGGHDVVVVQILCEEEIDPPLDGALRLIDAEDGGELRVTVDAELRAIYRERLAARLDRLETHCRRTGVEYLRASTAIPFEDVVLRYLRQGRHWR